MRIEVITKLEEFQRLKENWERVYDADPHAQLFLSWTWLFGWMPRLRDAWAVLAARDERSEADDYVAFWPLRIDTRIGEAGVLLNDVRMAGNFAADYTGLICLPTAENRAVPALARFLREMNWATLHLDNFRGSEQRFRQLLAFFPKSSFKFEEIDRVNKEDGVNNCICPYADLPGSFDDYLAGLSSNTRQKLRRLLRLVDEKGEYRITVATGETVERDLETLLQFWYKKWATRKANAIDSLIRTNRMMLRRCFELGLLYLPTVWQGDRPLVALATLTDPVKRAFLFYMTGRDESFDGPALGMLAHAYSIRHAIAHGFARYDFLRGDEDYKYSFAAAEQRISCLRIETRSGRNLGEKIDPRTASEALELTLKVHQDGKLAVADRCYRQIVASVPRNADALHRFGQLLTARGNHVEAKRTFAALTRVRPDAPKAWFCLAQSCEALRQLVEAETIYRHVATIEPQFPGIEQKLARFTPSRPPTEPQPAAPATMH